MGIRLSPDCHSENADYKPWFEAVEAYESVLRKCRKAAIVLLGLKVRAP
jgi:hypothetical protein